MKATNTLQRTPATKQSFGSFISGDSVQKMLMNTLHDPSRCASLTSTLISVVNSSTQLSNCTNASVVAAALRGEGMGLSVALGQYSIVPYGDTATFQLSYKGLSQLASRSGRYKDFGVFDVREGEYKGKDARTRQPIIEWKDDDERESLPLAGMYGFYELDNGFFKSVYWSHDKILNHADRYSKAFKKDLYLQMCEGKIKDEEQVRKLRAGSPWYDEPLSEAHLKMCKKTVLIQMLGDGTAPLSLEMQTAMRDEREVESNQGNVIYANDPVVVEANSSIPQKTVDADTGEIIEASDGQMKMGV